MTSPRSERGLDWFAFFLADVQTGWGPFVAAYLTSVAWTQFDIGRVLTIGTLTGLLLQVPAGAVVDRVRAKRLLAAVAVVAVSGSALVLALWPVWRAVVVAKVLHAIGSCLVGPAVAAISLGLVGHARLSVRLGRNARYLSLGNAIAAAAMGLAAYLYTDRAIFVLTAALGVPTLLALAQIRASEIDPALARGGVAPDDGPDGRIARWRQATLVVGRSRALMIFAAAVLLFQLANAALLPIIAGALTQLKAERAIVVVAVGILLPQLVVAALAPWVGRQAQVRGRRPLLALCFVALSIRAAIFGWSTHPGVVMAAQVLDGVSAATLGVLVPLVIADTTRGTGHFNLAQGAVGAAVGIGASLSTAGAGYVADVAGPGVVFGLLAAVAAAGLLLVVGLMPETGEARC